MAGVNKAILIGNLGVDPETRHTQSGAAVCNFRIATSESWKDKQTGEQREQTEWHNIVAWGRTAELCQQYLAKGRQVYIEGRIKTRSWQDRDGNKRYTTEVHADSVTFLGGRQDGASQGQQRSGGGSGYSDGASTPAGDGGGDAGNPWRDASDSPIASGQGGPVDDDIPF